MNKRYIDVVLATPADDEVTATLSFHLNRLGFSGFLESDNGLHCYISERLWTNKLQSDLHTFLNSYSSPQITISTTTEIHHQNWNQLWEESIQPIEVTERIIVTPSWHPVPAGEKKIILIIDPKMSFGTGYHESTRLMLRLLERHLPPNSFVLDVGTGTGVLAIAAVKLGARSAIGVDTDEWSSVNGKENVERNGLGERIDIRLGSLDVVPEFGFHAILANIIRGTIIELLPSMLVKLHQSGILLLSGLMIDDRRMVEEALHQHRCGILSELRENEWIGLAAKRT